jgi:hypothetical protein
MNRSTFSGSPAVNSACPNRDRKISVQAFSKTTGEPPNPAQWAAEELCTPSGPLRRTNHGRDISPCCQHFHPRPTSFRRDNLTKTETSGCAHKAFSFKSPIAHPPIAHFCQSPVLRIVLRVLRVFRGEPVFKSAIRNPQSAIRNPQSFSPRISAIIGNYRLSIFHPKQLKETNH